LIFQLIFSGLAASSGAAIVSTGAPRPRSIIATRHKPQTTVR
jgi:hypothetical protein